MCFSAEASFAIGAALVPAGGYCVAAAVRKRPRLLPLALVPLFFGMQQIGEGFVWVGLHRGDHSLVRSASMVFLFFALAFWPFYFPLQTALTESKPRKRLVFGLIAAAALGWFFVLYLPIISGPDSVLTTHVVQHSIHYDYAGLPVNRYVPQTLLRVFYFLCVAIPMAMGSESLGRAAGLAFGASAVVAVLLYDYAFVSVWCFFAAALALYLCWLFARIGSNDRVKEPVPIIRSRGCESA